MREEEDISEIFERTQMNELFFPRTYLSLSISDMSYFFTMLVMILVIILTMKIH